MIDDKRFSVAWARFDALRRNIPPWLKTEQVAEYHSIVDDLQEASGEDLSAFRIPDDQIKPRITAVTRGTIRSPGRAFYSKDAYCDDNFFARQVSALATYIQSLEERQQRSLVMDNPTNYWSMNDTELEILARKYNVPPYSRSGSQGENWYVDRDRIIDALVKRDNALRAGLPPPAPSNVVNVGTMYGSAIQQGTEQSSVMVDYKGEETGIRDLLKQIRESVNAMGLSPAARAQLEADAHTAEAQLASPHPKPLVIRECLRSIRNILEGMAGSLIASGLLLEIGKYVR